MIYHVTTKGMIDAAAESGLYEAPSLHTEGFIHACAAEQVQGVLERYYPDKTNLSLLHIDEALLTSMLKYELAASVNEMFPHIFGKINADAVVKTQKL